MKDGSITGNYGPEQTKTLLDGLRGLAVNHGLPLKMASALVMGTENPWVESLLLNEGVRIVTTFEYGTIHVELPQMRASRCQTVAVDFLAGRFEPVDLIVSYSSLEHSGLGRYGDALNPDGDKEAVAQVRPIFQLAPTHTLLTTIHYALSLVGLVHAAARGHLCSRLTNEVR
jgi:hypothetical protein